MSRALLERAARARERAEAAGQGQLFADWERLDEAQRARLVGEIEGTDLELVRELAGLLRERAVPPAASAIEPPEVFALEARDSRRAREAQARGAELLASGRVGYVTVAGGQASRLGFEGPKGAFGTGPVSGWSLFEILARRLRAARRRHGAPTPWYLMTSEANDQETRDFFSERDFLGLAEEDVFFFRQGMVPAMDFEGRILRSAPGGLFRAPNGHGGVIAALADSGALEDARRRGLAQLSYFQVDNPLVRPADPLFLGLHELAGAGMSSKVVGKRDPHEKVGVLGRVGGRMTCIEYSDLPDELRHARGAKGELLFGAGNIATHALELDFVEELARGDLRLPWHVARKKMRVWEEGGTLEREGAKFEMFVFDALERSPASVVLEVERASEFSPVKNAGGEDSPETARADICRLHAGWVERAGRPLPEPDPRGLRPVEVDPLLAETAEEFARRAPQRPEVTPRGHLWR